MFLYPCGFSKSPRFETLPFASFPNAAPGRRKLKTESTGRILRREAYWRDLAKGRTRHIMKMDFTRHFSYRFEDLHRQFRSWKPLSLCMLATLWILSIPSFGQGTVGTILGTVTTQDGAVLPNASVAVINEGTNARRSLTTDGTGNYQASELNPGLYTVDVTAPGFTESRNTGVVLDSQQTVRINATLKVGNTNSTVMVNASAEPVIETDTPSISTILDSEALADTTSNLLSTVDGTGDSGVVLLGSLIPAGYQEGGGWNWSLYGSRSPDAYYDVDGITLNSNMWTNMVGPTYPPFDMIQETEYSTVDNKAELNSMMDVSVITKSGTNQLHGGISDVYASNIFQARNYFANSVGRLVDNDPSAFLAGPVLKNKLFFFASAELSRIAEPSVLDASVPTSKFQNGDFSSLLTGSNPIVIHNPYTGVAYPNNKITTPLNPAAEYWQNRFYSPTVVPPNNGSADNYINNLIGIFAGHQYNNRLYLRGDYVFSPSNSLFARVGYVRASPEGPAGSLPASVQGAWIQKRPVWHAVIAETWVINPRMVNVAKAGILHDGNYYGMSLTGQPIVTSMGIQGFETAPDSATGIPAVNISDFTAPGATTQSVTNDQTIQYVDQLSYQRGAHALKAGVEYRVMQADALYLPNFGTFNFYGGFTGFPYADFLLGLPTQTSYTYTRAPQYSRLWTLGGFVQDDWNFRPNLTLYLGMRYDYDNPAVDKYDTVASFNPQTGAIVVPSASIEKDISPEFPSTIPVQTAAEAGFPRGMRNGYKLAAYPRVGFAYRPFKDNSTVIRGGYGIFNDHISAEQFTSLYGGPFGVTVSYTNPASLVGATPLVTLTNPINSAAGGIGSVSITTFDKNMRNPYVQQFNLTVERSLGSSTGLRLSYVGTRSAQLVYVDNINQVHASTTPFSQSAAPFPNFYAVNLYRNGGYQNYNAFVAEVKRNFKSGLSYNAAFTLASDMTDDQDGQQGNGSGALAEDSYDLSNQSGNAQYTPRLGFISNAVWDLPIGRGKKWLNTDNNASQTIIGGWKVSATYQAQSGDYLTATFNGVGPSNTNQTSGTAQRVNGVSISPVGKKSYTNWFNPAAFTIPANGTFGTGAWGVIEGPGMQTVNFAAFKTFHLYRESQFELKGSFTNLLNHTNFGDPDTAITDTSAGVITSTTTRLTAGPRSGIVSGRFTF